VRSSPLLRAGFRKLHHYHPPDSFANFHRRALSFDDVSKSDRQIEGQLSERPLAELIREIIDAELSGAIRLSRGPAKVVVYFDKGDLVFANSNLRAHRLREIFKRNKVAETQIDELPAMMSDEEVGAALIQQKVITVAQLQGLRLAQVTDV